MSRLSYDFSLLERICFSLNKLFQPSKGLERLRKNPTPEGRMEYSYQSALAKLESAFFFIDFAELNKKMVLDLGCGYGGFAVALSEKYEASVVGLDIERQALLSAKKMSRGRKGGSQRAHFLIGNSEELPFLPERFDFIFTLATMEHFSHPEKVLEECHRALRRHGQLFILFSPYYASNGAHLFDFIHIPWCHLFFSEKNLVRVWKRLAEENPDLAKMNTTIDLKKDRLTGINRLTVKKFKKLIRDSHFRLLGYQEKTYPHWHSSLLQKVPLLREALTVEILARLIK